MEVEEPGANNLINYSNLVEGNCEYLNFIKNIAFQRTRMLRDSIKTLDTYMQDADKKQIKTKLHFEGLVHLIIELAYFLYSCKNFGKSPEIELDDIRVEQSYVKVGEKRFNIVIFYRISDKNIEDKFAAEVFTSIMEHIGQALNNYIESRKQNQQAADGDSQYELALQTFWRQYQQIAQKQIWVQDEIKFFLYLEQTSIFYDYSLLYRIKTCSLLDYIKTNPARMDIFKEFEDKQENLLNNYQQEKKRLKGDQQVLRAKEKEIDENLQLFFQKIAQINIQQIQNSEKDSYHRVRFNFKLQEKQRSPFQEVLAELQGQNTTSEECKKDKRRPLAELQYFVEFSAQKNSISVKLFFPSITVNLQTSDFLMFQSNVLTFDAANVSIQLNEPKVKSQQKVPRKIVTFKGISSFNSSNPKQPLLQKVLLLMDIVMISSRIYQPEMNSQKYVQGGKQSYHKLNNVSKKVSHYTKLFMKCAKKVYDQ